MRLSDHLARGVCTGQLEKERQHIVTSPCVDITNVVNWLEEHPDSKYGDLTCCVPPFARCFLEWRTPGALWGVFVVREELDEGWLITISGAWGTIAGRPGYVAPGASMRKRISADGKPDADTSIAQWNVHPANATKEKFVRGVALFAFQFMNCAGTRLGWREPGRQERRREDRLGRPPLIRYQIIDIGPVTRLLETKGHIRQTGLRRALHICRGHFADYRSGAGLFGKHKQLVFVPDHTRGKADCGVVISDYRVKM